MGMKAAITVHRSREEVERLWQSLGSQPASVQGATVTFGDAPGDRGTEVHVDLARDAGGGRLGEIARKVTGAVPLAEVKDDLRRFKQRVETGEVARSDGVPEGELTQRKLKQRPAQPLEDAELTKAEAR